MNTKATKEKGFFKYANTKINYGKRKLKFNSNHKT